jgi:hypothetical protein
LPDWRPELGDTLVAAGGGSPVMQEPRGVLVWNVDPGYSAPPQAHPEQRRPGGVLGGRSTVHDLVVALQVPDDFDPARGLVDANDISVGVRTPLSGTWCVGNLLDVLTLHLRPHHCTQWTERA